MHNHFCNRHIWVLLFCLFNGLSQSLESEGRTAWLMSLITTNCMQKKFTWYMHKFALWSKLSIQRIPDSRICGNTQLNHLLPVELWGKQHYYIIYCEYLHLHSSPYHDQSQCLQWWRFSSQCGSQRSLLSLSTTGTWHKLKYKLAKHAEIKSIILWTKFGQEQNPHWHLCILHESPMFEWITNALPMKPILILNSINTKITTTEW